MGASNNLCSFETELAACAKARGLRIEPLGSALGHTLTIATRAARRAPAARLLIAAGFHGEEPAGPWGMVEFLRLAPDALLDRAELSLIPLVNASGFAAGRRLNDSGENPNRGYGARCGDDLPSAEGRVLVAHGQRLLHAAADGLLCCHEDLAEHATYAYTFEPGRAPGAFSHGLIDTAARYFALPPDGEIDGLPVRNGLIHNHYDGSFEAWLCESGVPAAACIETPGQQDFGRRVLAQAALMQAFVALRAGA